MVCFLFINAGSYKNLKTSNTDLRSANILLSIQDNKGKLHSIYKSSADEYFLDVKSGKELERIKIANNQAQEFDQFYVSQFIHLKYSMPSFEGKDCSKYYSLSMRGERQDICKQELKKIKIIASTLKKLKKLIP